jgi:hypothetical protein
MPVSCASCGARVLVAKFSQEHTSIQWDAAAIEACFEPGIAGQHGALIAVCPRLRASIEDAVAAGRLTVAPP